jgi:hypothetical protein
MTIPYATYDVWYVGYKKEKDKILNIKEFLNHVQSQISWDSFYVVS